jgi:hypothetical protein
MRHRDRDPGNAPNRDKVKPLRSEMVYEKGLRWARTYYLRIFWIYSKVAIIRSHFGTKIGVIEIGLNCSGVNGGYYGRHSEKPRNCN